MTAEVDLAAVAALIGDRSRATFLTALMDAQPRSLTELARLAQIAPATASAHLAKLTDGGLVAASKQGRQRYFRLAGRDVAAALEALSLIAPPRPVRSLRDAMLGEALTVARTCYDHLAGRLGVGLTDALLAQGWLRRNGNDFALTTKGRKQLTAFGLAVVALERERRPLARACLDWSERRHHLAGALGAALATELFHRRWLDRSGRGREVLLTPAGRAGLRRHFGLTVSPGEGH